MGMMDNGMVESGNSGRRKSSSPIISIIPTFHYSNLYYSPETPNLSDSHSTLVTRQFLPIMERPGASGKTARSAFWTKDDENFALPTARNTDRVLGPLDSIYVGSLQSGLDNFLGNQSGCRRWAVHFKLPPAHRRLHRIRFHALKKLSLAHASRHS